MDCYEKITEFYHTAKTEKYVVGESVFGRKIYAVKLGGGSPVGIAQYAIHGREFVTAELALNQYRYGKITGSIWLLPLVNPDGCLLSEKGLCSAPKELWDRLTKINNGVDFSLWKANGRGVDLNVNFAARWGQGTKNVRVPSSENYIGSRPFSEPETLALKEFTEFLSPDYTISYHTKGEEIYHRFDKEVKGEMPLAYALSKSTGYPLKQTIGSVGGYKDWCIQSLKIPSFTVEAGKDCFSHPFGVEELRDIIKHNLHALADLSKEAARVFGER